MAPVPFSHCCFLLPCASHELTLARRRPWALGLNCGCCGGTSWYRPALIAPLSASESFGRQPDSGQAGVGAGSGSVPLALWLSSGGVGGSWPRDHSPQVRDGAAESQVWPAQALLLPQAQGPGRGCAGGWTGRGGWQEWPSALCWGCLGPRSHFLPLKDSRCPGASRCLPPSRPHAVVG